MGERSSRTRQLILIAEARPTVALGLNVFLADVPGTDRVAIMTGFDDVVEYAESHKEIGLIIVGTGAQGGSPINELRRLRLKNPSWRLVLLADADDPKTIVTALSAGAKGIIPTSVEKPELQIAIIRLLAGMIYIPNGDTSIQHLHPVPSVRVAGQPCASSLTLRQFDVLRALAQGNSNKQIARILAVSESTVNMHLNAAFRALGVNDRINATLAFEKLRWSRHDTGYISDDFSNQPHSEGRMLM